MRKILLAPLIVCMVTLLSILSMPAVSAKVLRFDVTVIIDDWGIPGPLHDGETIYWKGPITGEITGTLYLWETDKNYLVGSTEHYFEDFYIKLENGWIIGYDIGVWNFATLKARAYGRVTGASDNNVGMIGYFFFYEGFSTDPNLWPIAATLPGFIGPV